MPRGHLIQRQVSTVDSSVIGVIFPPAFILTGTLNLCGMPKLVWLHHALPIQYILILPHSRIKRSWNIYHRFSPSLRESMVFICSASLSIHVRSLTIISKNIWFPSIKLEIPLKKMISIHPGALSAFPRENPSSLPSFSSQQPSGWGSCLLGLAAFSEFFSLTWINLFLLSKTKQNNNSKGKKIILNREQLESLKPVRIFMISSQQGWRRKKPWCPKEMKEGETQRNVSEGGGVNGNGSEINKGYRNVMGGRAQVRTTETTKAKLGGESGT